MHGVIRPDQSHGGPVGAPFEYKSQSQIVLTIFQFYAIAYMLRFYRFFGILSRVLLCYNLSFSNSTPCARCFRTFLSLAHAIFNFLLFIVSAYRRRTAIFTHVLLAALGCVPSVAKYTDPHSPTAAC